MSAIEPEMRSEATISASGTERDLRNAGSDKVDRPKIAPSCLPDCFNAIAGRQGLPFQNLGYRMDGKTSEVFLLPFTLASSLLLFFPLSLSCF